MAKSAYHPHPHLDMTKNRDQTTTWSGLIGINQNTLLQRTPKTILEGLQGLKNLPY